MATQLSPHFTLEELTTSDTARKHGLSNVPPTPELMARLKRTAEQLEAVRTALGGLPITVNSAFRTETVNKKVGGVPNSAHTKAYAVDFTCAAFGSPLQVAKKIASSGVKFDQLIHEKRIWVHISFEVRNGTMRQETLTLPPERGDYLPGLHA